MLSGRKKVLFKEKAFWLYLCHRFSHKKIPFLPETKRKVINVKAVYGSHPWCLYICMNLRRRTQKNVFAQQSCIPKMCVFFVHVPGVAEK